MMPNMSLSNLLAFSLPLNDGEMELKNDSLGDGGVELVGDFDLGDFVLVQGDEDRLGEEERAVLKVSDRARVSSRRLLRGGSLT